MSIRNIDRMLAPRSVAVIGASDTPGKVGHAALKNIITNGYTGAVYPVNSRSDTVQGQQAFPNVSAIDQVIDLAVVCTPSHTVPSIVRECGERGVGALAVLTAGFRELGEEGKQLEYQVKEEQRRYPGLRILGPNCVGLINPGIQLSASFAVGMPRAGHVAFLSQSGALCTSVLDWSLSQGIGFSHFLSLGNQLDVGFGDLLDYLAEDPNTASAILYIESIADARYFMSAARAFSRRKPLVAYKAGRFAESAMAAASHTGAMAGVDAVYQAALERAGIVRLFEMQSLFQCAELLTQHPNPIGSRLAIVTNAGGPGVMATDALLEQRGKLAKLAPETMERLSAFLPPNWSRGNPIDVIGDADAERFSKAVDVTLQDPNVDTVLAILSPQAMTHPSDTARRVSQLTIPTGKALMGAWMGGALMAEGSEILQNAGIATFTTPEQAIHGMMQLAAYSRTREVLYETPKTIVPDFAASTNERQSFLNALSLDYTSEHHSSSAILTEVDSKRLLTLYGIPTTPIEVAPTADAAVAISSRMGYPVVLKIYSQQITHKTDVGGVVLNLQSESQVRTAFEQMMARAARERPDAVLLGATVQPMITAVHGAELILGSKQDPIFGSVLMVGLGGITAELFQDRALELPPIQHRLALRMLESLRSWPLLNGYRGRPKANIDQIIEIMLRFSTMITEQPRILEADINPLLIAENQLLALDARFVIAPPSNAATRPYSHLAIRPYPSEFETRFRLEDGAEISLRPIRPEDETSWRAMLQRCSPESLQSRFRTVFKEATHEMATRFCFLDYDRELAFVAQETVGEKMPDVDAPILGVGRLVTDADRHVAEFAILVEDAWQGRGLGLEIATHCMNVARDWGVQRIVAETRFDEPRMRGILNALGFAMHEPDHEGTLLAEKEIAER
ncbi:MAG: bifunctional acetate--CoA ligase family protein/GNAT family N-acetyltransferase [Planctomycetes bacterium]|nr:bifunctional acetate--CoA ligase family protein/GNAT family N-acetyltransferase [Planctomycetota bacterium]